MYIKPGQKMIDPRDIEDEYDELKEEYDGLCLARDEAHEEYVETDDGSIELKDTYEHHLDYVDEWERDNLETMLELENILQTINDYSNITETMICEDHFTQYAQEYAQDMGIVHKRHMNEWPFNCINWEDAAEQLMEDYTVIIYKGYTYYILTR